MVSAGFMIVTSERLVESGEVEVLGPQPNRRILTIPCLY